MPLNYRDVAIEQVDVPR